MYCSFSVHPEEIAAYREIAKLDGRSLSWWIRDALNKAVALIREKNHETPNLETVPTDHAVDHTDRG